MNHFHKLETGNYDNSVNNNINTTVHSKEMYVTVVFPLILLGTSFIINTGHTHINTMTDIVNNLQLSIEVPTVCVALFIKVEVMGYLGDCK